MRTFFAVLACLAVLPPVVAAQAPPFSLRYLDFRSQGTAALWTDFDGDGTTDFFFANGQDVHSLYRQTAPGIYKAEGGSFPAPQLTDGVFADLDGDGDRDFLHGSLNYNTCFANENGVFIARSVPGLGTFPDTRTIETVDVDGDGRLDIFAGTRNQQRNVLLLQTADGWQNAPGDLPNDTSTSNAACWGDLDGDGDLDAYVANSGGAPNRAFRNDGGGALNAWDLGIEEDAEDASTSCLLGDADGDLDLDLFVTVANGRPSRLYLNEDGAFTQAPDEVFPALVGDFFNASWGDLDNDGDLDLVVVGRDEPVRAFIANGGRFAEAVLETERSSISFCTAVALHDLDGDGDLDAAISAGDSNTVERSFVLRSDLAGGGGWVDIALRGTVSNREGIGAAVTAYLSDADRSWAVRQTALAHTSRRTQSDIERHVGSGAATLDSVAVRWPTGVRDVYTGLAVGERALLVERPPVSAAPGPHDLGLSLDVRPNPASGPIRAALRSSTDGAATVEVFDASGRRVWRRARVLRAGVREDIEIDLDRPAAGIYVVRVRQDDAAVSTRVTLGAGR